MNKTQKKETLEGINGFLFKETAIRNETNELSCNGFTVSACHSSDVAPIGFKPTGLFVPVSIAPERELDEFTEADKPWIEEMRQKQMTWDDW